MLNFVTTPVPPVGRPSAAKVQAQLHARVKYYKGVLASTTEQLHNESHELQAEMGRQGSARGVSIIERQRMALLRRYEAVVNAQLEELDALRRYSQHAGI